MESIVDKIIEQLKEMDLTLQVEVAAELDLDVQPDTEENEKARRRLIDFLLDTIDQAGMVVSDKEHLKREFAHKDEQIEHWKKRYKEKIFANG